MITGDSLATLMQEGREGEDNYEAAPVDEGRHPDTKGARAREEENKRDRAEA